MALTTYSELQTTIKNWLHRSDLDSIIPDFIAMCEADYNRRLRLSVMESRVQATLDEQWESLPDDFLEMRSLQTTGSTGRELQYVSPDIFNRMYKTSDSGEPKYFTIAGNALGIAPTPDSTSWTMEMIYYAKIAALSNSNTSNWMLTNNPDLYVFGSLVMAEGHVKNDARILVWKQQYDIAVDQVQGQDHRFRYPQGMAMAIRPV